MKKGTVYINRRFVPSEEAYIPVFDRGFMYGDGIFETMKARKGSPLFFDDHMERLKKGLSLLSIGIGDVEEVVGRKVVERLIHMNGLSHRDAYVRITITRGVDRTGLVLPSQDTEPTIVMVAKPIDGRRIARLKRYGARGVFVEGPLPSLPMVKSLNFLPGILARMEAHRQDAFEGIFIGQDSRLREGTSSSLFIVSSGVVKTPPLDTGILPGITRKKVIEICMERNIPFEERELFSGDLLGCEEAFITNSILDVVPLTGINGRTIGDGMPGGITRRIQRYFEGLARRVS